MAIRPRLSGSGTVGPAGPAGPSGPAGPAGPAGAGAFSELLAFKHADSGDADLLTSVVVPEGKTRARIACWGGGAGGDRAGLPTDSRTGGCAGGYAVRYIEVTPGETLSIRVGKRGLGGSSTVARSDGGDSSVSRGVTLLVLATGGQLLSPGGYFDAYSDFGMPGGKGSTTLDPSGWFVGVGGDCPNGGQGGRYGDLGAEAGSFPGGGGTSVHSGGGTFGGDGAAGLVTIEW